MRRRLTLLVGATTSLVLVAFLVPLALLVHTVAHDRAISSAAIEARALSAVVTGDEAALRSVVQRTNAGEPFPVTVFRPDGTVIGEPAPESPAVRLARTGRTLNAELPDGGIEVLFSVGAAEGTSVIRVYVGPEEQRAGVYRAWLILALLGTTLLGIGLLVANRLARSLVRSIDGLADTSRRLAEGDLTARARPEGPPEISAVAGTLNTLATRISDLLVRERERVADLSHRVRTPLTALRLDVESVRDPAERERLEMSVAALERAVTRSINDARRPAGEGGRCDATRVVRERVEFWSVLAEDQERPLTVELPDRPLPVGLPDDELEPAVDALLGNVFAHTPDGTAFAVRLRPGGPDGAVLVVEDEGPGLPESATERGTSGAGSSGLGLDIARRAAESSGGSLAADSPSGARITLVLGAPVER
ncbi:sensor histidine kinase [Marinitenerispora sediminis]|uniref:Signal transduction histidine-protein kinase/phosphatase MprB n=1 Tax=Marinitenerispora sediminis TaxID=1931232 RepID=A0A368T1G4_9ACTN|nr:HAMP domain-containing sensor histidine kinase [Marinitenerispora sediminis]RCV50437.1 two-component sensor histidine kinase [Marinitenerispora sediminis]RCV53721.1 two-component sensor histidine kinase [Marinitenerispora sediminis]RCV53871.1 two-component sensor histidine kinase [Marinitenerispora sediminis]